jgi:hypothetical protein
MYCSQNGENEEGIVCCVREIIQTDSDSRDDSRRNSIFGQKEKGEQNKICEMSGSSYNSS